MRLRKKLSTALWLRLSCADLSLLVERLSLRYYEIVIGCIRLAYKRVVEEVEGLDNDLYVLVLAGSKVVLWMRRVYICSAALFRRAIQYIIGVKDRVERRVSLKR
jgi:hypothetical protein